MDKDETPGPAPAVELVDFGGGRRLERFGRYLLDRPAPAVEGLAPARPAAWATADARFDRETGWTPAEALLAAWTVETDGLTLELRPTATGQVGLFPEHAEPARLLATAVETLAVRAGRPPEILSLFAYTGLATLLLARAGARVAHVDSSRPAVAWARRNAELSGLGNASVRWLIEDAATFTAREVRRGRRYDAIILDPPTYGHAPRGGGWRIDDGLSALLRDCASLTGDDPGALLLTAHTTGLEVADLRGAAAAAWGSGVARRLRALPLGAERADGIRLPAGRCLILLP